MQESIEINNWGEQLDSPVCVQTESWQTSGTAAPRVVSIRLPQRQPGIQSYYFTDTLQSAKEFKNSSQATGGGAGPKKAGCCQ